MSSTEGQCERVAADIAQDEDVCLKTVPGFCAIGEPLSGTSYMPESGGGRIERMEVPGIVRKLDRPRLSHVLN